MRTDFQTDLVDSSLDRESPPDDLSQLSFFVEQSVVGIPPSGGALMRSDNLESPPTTAALCALCSQQRPAATRLTVTTAIMNHSSRKSGFKEYTTTTTTTRIEHRLLAVCSQCRSNAKRRQFGAVLLAAAAGAIAIPMLISAGAPGEITGLAACVLLVAAVMGGLYLSLPMMVKKQALKTRQRAQNLPIRANTPGPHLVAFTEPEFRRFSARQRR